MNFRRYMTDEEIDAVRERAQDYLDAGYSPLSLSHLQTHPTDGLIWGISTPIRPLERLDGHTETYYSLGDLAGLNWSVSDWVKAAHVLREWDAQPRQIRGNTTAIAELVDGVWTFAIVSHAEAIASRYCYVLS